MDLLMARTLFEFGEFERARAKLCNSGNTEAVDLDPPTAHLRGLLELCAGKESDADIPLRTATAGLPHLMAPHQNLAARNPPDYEPTQLMLRLDQTAGLFDAYNYLGQAGDPRRNGATQHQAVRQGLRGSETLAKQHAPVSRRAHRTSPISAFLSRMSEYLLRNGRPK